MPSALGRMARRIGAVVLIVVSANAATAAARTGHDTALPAASPPAQVIVIRHAEKPSDPTDPHLPPEGVAHAKRWVSFFMKDPAATRFGRPVAVFATKMTKDDNGQRTQETMKPLADALGLSVLTPYHGNDYAALAKLILSETAYAGKTVVVCWNHEDIPQLVSALGVTPEPPQWSGHVFDQVYLITYRNGTAVLTVQHERETAPQG
jgi:hypothetical protein